MIELPPKPPREASEAELVTAILNAVRVIPGVACTRNNTGKTPMPCEACRRAMCPRCLARMARPITYGLGEGGPDIVGVYTHRVGALAFGLEVKRPRPRLRDGSESQAEDRSPEQVAWHKAAAARGMPVWTVRGVDEATGAVGAWIAGLP